MNRLQDRVAVITGAGRGIGREIALLMASQGAKIVVNDLGANTDGTGSTMIADEVVAEIKAAGGEAVSNTDSVADVAGGERLIQTAIAPKAPPSASEPVSPINTAAGGALYHRKPRPPPMTAEVNTSNSPVPAT